MKKLLTILLALALLAGCLVGCNKTDDKGDAEKETDSKKETEYVEDDEEDSTGYKEKTLSFDASDVVNEKSLKFEITYNAGAIQTADEIFDDAPPVEDLTYGIAAFYHMENGSSFELRFMPGYYSAESYYKSEVESYSNNDHYTKAEFSQCEDVAIGDIKAQTYSLDLVWDDGDLMYRYWVLQFESGIALIESYGDEDSLAIASEDIKELLIKVTMDGKAPGKLENVYTLYDYNTGAALYTVTFNTSVFSVNKDCDATGGEMILNYNDSSLAYPEMKIYVNKYNSGKALFESKAEYSYGINYYEGDDGNYLETDGQIGDAIVYIGLGLSKDNGKGYVFFAEMADGNVITGNIPGSYVGDELQIMSAFTTIKPAE